MPLTRLLCLLPPFALLLAGCARETPGELQVYAAASLREAATELARDFEAANPGTRVQLSFAGSQALRLQIAQGARTDVFASANAEHVAALHAAGLTGRGRAFAAGALVLAVPTTNPANLRDLCDLPNVRHLVLGSADVPVGRYARALLRKAEARCGAGFAARSLARLASEEVNTRLVAAKVAMGEADAALIYRTDARARPGIRALPLPADLAAPVRYVATTTRDASPMAKPFLAWLTSPAAQTTLRRHGFEAAP